MRARDSAIDRMLPHVQRLGWTVRALAEGAGPDTDLLFPGGPASMVEAYIDLADRRMIEAATPALVAQRPSARIRTLILERLRQAEPDREAVRRALAILAQPQNLATATRTAARTVDRMWHAAGDTSADFSWYTKRAILASVYGATLLYWLRGTPDEAGVAAFLDRRLAGVAVIGKLKARFSGSKAAPAKP